jgi:hypothetical protein
MQLSVDEIVRYAYDAGYRGLELAAISAISLAEGGAPESTNNTAYPDKPGYKPVAAGAVPEYSLGPLQINIGPGAHNYTEAQIRDPASAFKIAYTDFGSDFNQWSTYGTGPGHTNASAAYLPEVAAAIARMEGLLVEGGQVPSQPSTTTFGGSVGNAPTLQQQYSLTDADFRTGGSAAPPSAQTVALGREDIGNAITGGATGAIDALKATGESVVTLIKWLTNPSHWWRIFFLLAGGALMLVGLGIYLRPEVELQPPTPIRMAA